MHSAAFALTTAIAVLLLLPEVTNGYGHGAKPEQNEKPFGDISLWIDQQQIKTFSGNSPTKRSEFSLRISSSFFSLRLPDRPILFTVSHAANDTI